MTSKPADTAVKPTKKKTAQKSNSRNTHPKPKKIKRIRGTEQTYDRVACMEVICACISVGMPLAKICEANKDTIPTINTIFNWLNEDVDLLSQYMRAREASADHLADEIVWIADNEPDPNVARVRIDARKWVAAKLKPKRYGDKITTEHTGAEGKPLDLQVNFVIPGQPARREIVADESGNVLENNGG